MGNNHKNEETGKKESERILKRVEIDAESIGSSSLVRSAEKTRDHFIGKEIDPDDPIELWGTRIGRVLSLVAVVLLATYLYNTYLSG